MRNWMLLGLGATAIGGVALGRRYALHEDLNWETVAKPGRISYRHMLPVLSRDHRAIAVDLKGYGYSERDADSALSQSDQVTMLAGLLDRLDVEDAVVVGHSMGGAVAQRFAATHPKRVHALVLAASAPVELRPPPMNIPDTVLRPVLPALAGFAARRIFSASFYDRAKATPDVLEEYIRPSRIRGSMDGLLRMTRDRANDAPVETSGIKQPVLLLFAADDRIVKLHRAREMRERLPQARLVVVDRAGHLLMEERPDECNAAVIGFLRDLRRASQAVPATAG
jgi:pimeloyl-ACP methyl ester carboxylesterase